jgi:hypothetical protein
MATQQPRSWCQVSIRSHTNQLVVPSRCLDRWYGKDTLAQDYGHALSLVGCLQSLHPTQCHSAAGKGGMLVHAALVDSPWLPVTCPCNKEASGGSTVLPCVGRKQLCCNPTHQKCHYSLHRVSCFQLILSKFVCLRMLSAQQHGNRSPQRHDSATYTPSTVWHTCMQCHTVPLDAACLPVGYIM